MSNAYTLSTLQPRIRIRGIDANDHYCMKGFELKVVTAYWTDRGSTLNDVATVVALAGY